MKALAVALVCCVFACYSNGRARAWMPTSGLTVADQQSGESRLKSLEDYLNTRAEPIDIEQLGGILVRDDRAELVDGEQMSGVAVVDVSGLGKSWDLIVGVDGYRVKNAFDLMQALQEAQPGDKVYLAIVRKGRRMQIVLPMP
jgi:S1-C subfamily serine protease